MPSGNSWKDVLRPWVYRMRNTRDRMLGGACTVLLYHRVIDIPSDPQQLAVGPAEFEAHLQVLKSRYRVLTVAEFDHHLLHGKRFPHRSVLLTFDDGYADNHYFARPLLEKYGMQALFYIASGYMGSGLEFWWDEVERLLLYRPVPLELDLQLPGLRLKVPDAGATPNRGDDQEAYASALVQLRKLPGNERDALLEKLRSSIGPAEPRSTHLPMSVEELREFAASPAVVIGAHTVLHPSLAQLPEGEQRQEISASKAQLEHLLGKSVPYFSYPFGTGADFSATTERMAREAGFRHTAANYPGFVHARSPRHRFPRHLVRNWQGPEFAHRMEQFAP